MKTVSVHARIDPDLVPVWERLGRSAWFNALLRAMSEKPELNPVPAVIRGEVMRRIYAALPGDWKVVAARTGFDRNSITGPMVRLQRAGLIHVHHRVQGDGPTRYWYEQGPGLGVPISMTPVVIVPGQAENTDRRMRKQRSSEPAPIENRDPLFALYGKGFTNE